MAEPKKDNELSEAGRRLGRKGGRIGGPKRAEVLSAEERSEIARKGGLAKSAKSKSVKDRIKKRKKKES